MCGIAGFAGPWNDQLLGSMLKAIEHRGPDGQGTWRDRSCGVALGHVRLSIIDLSTAANQPMHSADGRYTLCFNGEIYNFRALRAELEATEATFRTQSDTEVLLQMFARYGERCLERLQGIFAFAVWDRERRRLFLARDQLGVKPLYYAVLPMGVLFASELKALVACPDLPRDVDPATAANHLGFVWSSTDATMLKSVRKLRPGHFAWVDLPNRLVATRYYVVPVPAADRRSVSPSDLLALFDEVVADQMVADVPIGAFLSGGVDSSAIVASMCRTADPSRITTFCASVTPDRSHADNFGDDIVYARQMAQSLGVPLVEVPTEADLIGELPGMIWQLDEPTADFAALQSRMVAAEARRRGVKVLLSGIGGDDLFTGYGRHRAAYLWAMLDRWPPARALAARIIACWPSASLVGRRLARLGALLRLSEEDMLSEAMSFAATTPEERLGLFQPHLRRALGNTGRPDSFAAILERTRGCHPVERLLQLDLDGFLPDLNLNYADKTGMQEGVELRVPILDTRLVAYAMQVPIEQKIDLWQTKKIFREAVAGRVSRGVLTRAKQGFGMPVRAWLAGPGHELLQELTSPSVVTARGLFDAPAVARLTRTFEQQKGDLAFTLFAMMAIELWCRALDAHPAMARQAVAAPA